MKNALWLKPNASHEDTAHTLQTVVVATAHLLATTTAKAVGAANMGEVSNETIAHASASMMVKADTMHDLPSLNISAVWTDLRGVEADRDHCHAVTQSTPDLDLHLATDARDQGRGRAHQRHAIVHASTQHANETTIVIDIVTNEQDIML